MMRARGRSFVWGLALSLAVFAGMVGPMARAQSDAASISLFPSSGPPGSSTLVSGQGFGPNETVILGFDVLAVGSAMTDGAGSFSKTIQIPKGARPGPHGVFARGQRSGLFASATFTVTLVDWQLFRFEPAHSGFNPFESMINPGNVSGLTIKWIGNG